MLEGMHSEEVHILLTPSLSSIFRVFMKRKVGHISSTAHTSLLELNQYNELNWTGMPFYSTKIQLFYLCISQSICVFKDLSYTMVCADQCLYNCNGCGVFLGVLKHNKNLKHNCCPVLEFILGSCAYKTLSELNL